MSYLNVRIKKVSINGRLDGTGNIMMSDLLLNICMKIKHDLNSSFKDLFLPATIIQNHY